MSCFLPVGVSVVKFNFSNVLAEEEAENHSRIKMCGVWMIIKIKSYRTKDNNQEKNLKSDTKIPSVH